MGKAQVIEYDHIASLPTHLMSQAIEHIVDPRDNLRKDNGPVAVVGLTRQPIGTQKLN